MQETRNKNDYLNNEVVAATLTSAVYTNILAMQLQGKSITISESIDVVRNTWMEIMQDKMVNEIMKTIPLSQVATTVPQGNLSSTDFSSSKEITFSDTLRTNEAGFDSLVGISLDSRYKILQILGEGGMGKVYLAEQLGTGRKTAIKVIYTQSGDKRDQVIRYFQQEAKALARMNHQNIAQVYDASTIGQDFYIAMEYIEGMSLRNYLQQKQILEVEDVVSILSEICKGLATAHKLGIIHRDIKPENIMLKNDEMKATSVKILDFGLAILDEKDADQNITGVGMLTGTIAYMSPEQVQSMQLTPATDIYSLGVIAYEMLTGKNPFIANNINQTFYNHLHLKPTPPSDSIKNIPLKVESAILKALEKDASNRFRTAEDFLQSL
jgi:serine/threonine-protein kinase